MFFSEGKEEEDADSAVMGHILLAVCLCGVTFLDSVFLDAAVMIGRLTEHSYSSDDILDSCGTLVTGNCTCLTEQLRTLCR